MSIKRERGISVTTVYHFLFAAIAIHLLVPLSMLQAQESDNRIVAFPGDQSLGVISAAPANSYTEEILYWHDLEITEIGLAQGSVSIPRDSFICLELSQHASQDLSVLNRIPRGVVDGLYIRNADLTDQCQHIGQMNELRLLTLAGCVISDDEMKALAELRKLEILDCSVHGQTRNGAGITDDGLKVVSGFTRLRALNLRGNPVTDDGLEALGVCDSLRFLGLAGTKVRGPGLDNLMMLPNLEVLVFGTYEDGALIGDEAMHSVVQLDSLKTLSLNGTRITEEGMARLGELTSLESLSLDYTEISDDALKHVSGLPNLRYLGCWTKKEARGDVAVEHLSGMKNLEEIGAHLSLTDAGFKHLANMKNLKHLSLARDVSDDQLKHVARIESLEWLFLSLCPITDEGIKHLESLPNLELFNLQGGAVTGKSLRSLARLPKLKHLNIRFSHDQAFGDQKNWLALQKMSELEVLNISTHQISDHTFGAISKLSRLKSLWLSHHRTPLGTRFFESVAHLKNLERLSVIHVKSTDEHIAKLLELQNLQFLSMSGAVTDEQLLSLAKLSNLRDIRIGSSLLSGSAIEEFKRICPSLTRFSLTQERQ